MVFGWLVGLWYLYTIEARTRGFSLFCRVVNKCFLRAGRLNGFPIGVAHIN